MVQISSKRHCIHIRYMDGHSPDQLYFSSWNFNSYFKNPTESVKTIIHHELNLRQFNVT